MSTTLGEKVRSIRESRNVSLQELSERSEIPVEVIEQIEAGTLVTSLTPLLRIARILGVRLGTFVDDQESLGPVVTKTGSETAVVRVGNTVQVGAMDFFSLAQGKAGRHMEPFLIRIEGSSRENIRLSSHEGEEFIHVLEGRVEINYGRETYHLEQGDSIYYDSIVQHHVHSADGEIARILAVVYAPL